MPVAVYWRSTSQSPRVIDRKVFFKLISELCQGKLSYVTLKGVISEYGPTSVLLRDPQLHDLVTDPILLLAYEAFTLPLLKKTHRSFNKAPTVKPEETQAGRKSKPITSTLINFEFPLSEKSD